jgi:hypothetical protein
MCARDGARLAAAASAFFSDNSSVSAGIVITADNKYLRIP